MGGQWIMSSLQWPHDIAQNVPMFPLLWFLMVFLLILAAWYSDPLTCSAPKIVPKDCLLVQPNSIWGFSLATGVLSGTTRLQEGK